MITKNQTDYQATIVVHADAVKAFEGINHVSDWWTRNIKGNTHKKGDKFTVQFGETYSDFEIIEMTDHRRIKWLVLDCNLHWMKDKKEWKGTEILWEITPLKGASEIHMTHIGLGPQIECFEDCTRGWNHYVKESLFKFIKEGKGAPDDPNHSARTRQ